MLNIAVFVSGKGSNLEAILRAFPRGNNSVLVRAVVGSSSKCNALLVAENEGIPNFFLSEEGEEGSVSNSELEEKLESLGIGLIVLAGYLKKIPDDLVDSYQDRIINIHPALLPSFGGKGFYGLNVHKAVFDESCKVTGATVHFVDKVYDRGKIIAQRAVDISQVSSPEEIAGKVLEIEHQLLPFVIRKFAENKIEIGKRIKILE